MTTHHTDTQAEAEVYWYDRCKAIWSNPDFGQGSVRLSFEPSEKLKEKLFLLADDCDMRIVFESLEDHWYICAARRTHTPTTPKRSTP